MLKERRGAIPATIINPGRNHEIDGEIGALDALAELDIALGLAGSPAIRDLSTKALTIAEWSR